MIIAMAIMAIVFAAILPQFRAILNSWDSKQAAAETLQNGRVLMDHLYRNLSKAARIIAVSDSSTTNGYIEFVDNDANSFRYDVNSISSYVEFGLIGSLSDLAGPVSQLQFTCYDASDLDTPITDVTAIRCVKVETTLTNTGPGQDKGFSTWAYLRTNYQDDDTGGEGWTISKPYEPWLEFDAVAGMEPALVQMTATKYLCAYRGDKDDGYACILTVDANNWSVSASGFLEYDTKNGVAPALARINDSHSLCAYTGDKADGWACMLYEWPEGSGTLEVGPQLEFDPDIGDFPALCHIVTQGDDHYYLCAYANTGTAVQALVLHARYVPYVLMNLTAGLAFPFDVGGTSPALSKIDDTHYLCGYTGTYQDGWSIVLTVDTVDWTVCGETLFGCTEGTYALEPDLAKIDDTYYLYVFSTNIWEGCALIITVHPEDWTLSKDHAYSHYVFDSVGAADLELCQIDSTNFLCAYYGPPNVGLVTVLTVDTGDLSMSHQPAFTFEPDVCANPALCKIDASHYLCAYEGSAGLGYVGVLEVSSGVPPLKP